MLAGGEFGHDAAEAFVYGHLGRDHRRQDLTPVAHERSGCFVTGSFDTEYEHTATKRHKQHKNGQERILANVEA
jgi:hypothetical protein